MLSNTIKELKNKYRWLNQLNDFELFYNDRQLDEKKTVKENGLNDLNLIQIDYNDQDDGDEEGTKDSGDDSEEDE